MPRPRSRARPPTRSRRGKGRAARRRSASGSRRSCPRRRSRRSRCRRGVRRAAGTRRSRQPRQARTGSRSPSGHSRARRKSTPPSSATWILAPCDSCSCTEPGTAAGASRRSVASSSALGHEVIGTRPAVRRRLADPARLRAPDRAAAGRDRGRPLTRRAHHPSRRGPRPRLPRGDPADRGRLYSGRLPRVRRLPARRAGTLLLAGSRDGPHAPVSRLHGRAGSLGLRPPAPAGPDRGAGRLVRRRATSRSPASATRPSTRRGRSARAASTSDASSSSTPATRRSSPTRPSSPPAGVHF